MSSETVSVFSVCDFAAGWASGVCGLIVGHPLDTIKVRQQILGKIGPLGIIASTFKHEGILGFYKGMSFPLFTSGALNAVFFGVYGNTLRSLEGLRQQPLGRTLCCEGTPAYPGYHWDVFYAGCAGGATTVVFSTPIELVKTQLQAQVGDKKLKGLTARTSEYRGPWECLSDLYKVKGIRGCYRGLVPMLWRDIPTFGFYVLTYEHVVCLLRDPLYRQHKSTIHDEIFAGAAAGFISWGTIIPFDVVKSRIQADSKTHPKYNGMIDCFIKSYNTGGIRVFFTGFTVTVLRALPVNAATFVGYELFISLCKEQRKTL